MTTPEIRRISDDLKTLRQAAGLDDLPFGWTDVKLKLALALAGLFLAIWAPLAAKAYLAVGVIPALLVAAAATWRLRDRRRLGLAASREVRREILSVVLCGVVMGVFYLWSNKLQLPSRTANGLLAFLFGVSFVFLGLTDRVRRHYLAVAAMLVPFGLIMPFCESKSTVLAVGGLLMTGVSILAAAIQSWQLRDAGKSHASAAH